METQNDTDLMAQGLADAVGATKRQIQTWTDAGILLCRPETDRQGTGIRRKYPREQRAVAAFVTALSRFKLHIGELIVYAGHLRSWLTEYDENPEVEWADGIRGEKQYWIIAFPKIIGSENPLFDPDAEEHEGDMILVDEKEIVPALAHPLYRMGIIINVKEVISPFVE